LPICGIGHDEDSRDGFADDEGDAEEASGDGGCEWRRILPTSRFTLLVALWGAEGCEAVFMMTVMAEYLTYGMKRRTMKRRLGDGVYNG
jgi:hypothetical protein